KLRVFGLADQNQVMTSDDPLNLSNHKDYWEHSKWLDQWKPVEVMRDNTQGTTILRGHYEDEEAFYAKDSSGNYLTLLRGAALEADFGRTYVGMMTASRFGLWDEYQTLDNIPGAIRVKHMVTPQWMLGSLYTYRIGLIDREPDSFNQVLSFDTKYFTNETDYMYAQAAGSLHEVDRLSEVQIAGEDIRRDYEGYAYKTGFVMNTNTSWFGESKVHGDFAWMDAKFKPELSKYTSTRDDELWGTQITFAEIPPDLEPYKIGTGLDRGRYVGRLSIESNNLSQGWTNEFDMRHVRRTDSNSFIEHVMRNEFTVNLASGLTGKVFGRSHILPKTQSDVEPFLSSFIFTEDEDPALFGVVQLTNSDIDPGLDPSQNTWGLGLQYEVNNQWTVESSWSHTNEVHDFPRGLQNGLALNSPYPDPEFPSVLLDRTIPFLYGQHVYGLPPYDYYSIVKERLIYQPADKLQFIFHAAQNSNRLWGPIDENFNHQGISVDYQINDRWSMFFDYTHSRQVNVDRLINTNYQEFNIVDHHNIYGILKYKINPSSVLTMEYGVFGDNLYNNEGSLALPASQYAVTTFSLPTLDTEHLFRIRLEGEF
ncbi:MAG: hypothetical protein KC649_00505, partial [Candidatus Omnitrophica bacterium]|nr:hypothetical protein [Candidatus Omnitrophota bacterium]